MGDEAVALGSEIKAREGKKEEKAFLLHGTANGNLGRWGKKGS